MAYNPKAGKQADISILRLLATLAVINTHVNSMVLASVERHALTEAQIDFLDTAAHCMPWHVPVFFLITGALLLDKGRKLTARGCVRRAARVLLALIFFGIPYGIMKAAFQAKSLTLRVLGEGLLNALNGDSWDHLWYLYALVGIYLLLPVIRRFTDQASRKEIRYVLAVLFVYDFCFPLIDNVLKTHIGFASPFTYPVFYLLLGHYLADGVPRLLRNKKICAGILICSLFANLIFHKTLYPVFRTYNSPGAALLAACAFCVFRGCRLREKWNDKLWKLDRLCFGVYLIHPLIINVVYRVLHFTPVSFSRYYLALPVFYIAFVVLSFLGAWLMSLIPPLKKYIL